MIPSPLKSLITPLFSKKEMVSLLTKLSMIPFSLLVNSTICPSLVNVPLMLPELVKSVRIESAILVIFPLIVPALSMVPFVAWKFRVSLPLPIVNVSPLSTLILLVMLPLPL